MLGEGITHGTAVSSQYIPRDQPSIGTTSSVAPNSKRSLKKSASSAMVNP
jgi:hypothetical protein